MYKLIVNFARESKEVILPSKRDEDGGFDIYAYFKEGYVVIPKHEVKMIPTGIRSAFSSDYAAILKERGSTGTKGIAQRSGVIDSGFRGEWKVPVGNTTDKTLIIAKSEKVVEKDGELIDIETSQSLGMAQDCIVYPYEKAITQAVFVPIPKLEVREISVDMLKDIKSERGEGMLWSSKK